MECITITISPESFKALRNGDHFLEVESSALIFKIDSRLIVYKNVTFWKFWKLRRMSFKIIDRISVGRTDPRNRSIMLKLELLTTNIKQHECN